MNKYAGVVVLYRPDQKILKNIQTYLSEIDYLFIIDNTPNQNHQDWFTDQKMYYVANNENKGIATALNQGAILAKEHKCNWLLTMDQDSKFKKKNILCLKKFVEQCDDSIVGLVSPWHVTKTGEKKPSQKTEELVEVMTSGNFVNLKAYQAVGGWKDWLFIDSVDIEFCMNLNVHGFKVIRYNEAELIHNLGDIKIKRIFTRNFVCSNHNYIRQYYMTRNMLYVNEMYHDKFPEYCAFIRRGTWGRIKNILIWEKDRYRKIRNIYRGYRDYKKKIRGSYPYKN